MLILLVAASEKLLKTQTFKNSGRRHWLKFWIFFPLLLVLIYNPGSDSHVPRLPVWHAGGCHLVRELGVKRFKGKDLTITRNVAAEFLSKTNASADSFSTCTELIMPRQQELQQTATASLYLHTALTHP